MGEDENRREQASRIRQERRKGENKYFIPHYWVLIIGLCSGKPLSDE